MGKKSLTIVGPTACGKTSKAVAAAKAFDGEIISADSRQVYSEMSIGTGKDLDEYGDVRYHLIDIAKAGTKYNLHQYLRDFNNALTDIESRGKFPVICGGSGMYVENAIRGVRLPEVPCNPALREELKGKDLSELTSILSQYKTLHNTTDVDTVQRAIRAIEIQRYYLANPEEAALAEYANAEPLDTMVVGLDISREKRRDRISTRLRTRLNQGMVDEVKHLLDSGILAEDLIYYGLEYKFVTLYLIGKLTYDEMVHDLEIAIHQFAKRQMTWFRGMEKRGTQITWLPYDLSDEEFIDTVAELIQ